MRRMKERRQLRLVLVAALAAGLVAGCQTMSDVRPGEGRKEVIQGHSYAQVWDAAEKVARTHFGIKEQDKAKGTILAERPVSVWSYGALVGIYITPPGGSASAYTVEVVSRRRVASDIGVYEWEPKVLGDMRDTLAGRPITKVP
jgi:hypothetical protein